MDCVRRAGHKHEIGGVESRREKLAELRRTIDEDQIVTLAVLFELIPQPVRQVVGLHLESGEAGTRSRFSSGLSGASE